MVERDFAPRGRMGVQLKDMRNALATAQEIGFDAPITTLFETSTPTACNTAWVNSTTVACSSNWPAAMPCNERPTDKKWLQCLQSPKKIRHNSSLCCDAETVSKVGS